MNETIEGYKKYLAWKEDRDAILQQYDHAFGNGKPPIRERKSTIDTPLVKNKK